MPVLEATPVRATPNYRRCNQCDRRINIRNQFAEGTMGNLCSTCGCSMYFWCPEGNLGGHWASQLEVVTLHDRSIVCDWHSTACDECDELFRVSEFVGRSLCSDCEDLLGDEAQDDEDDFRYDDRSVDRGLLNYGHTGGRHWLGGPVRSAGGYYIGFELEITANRYNPRTSYVYQWAQDNLGYADAIDCKEDCSVAGFEMASQPMTPAFFESVDWDSYFAMLNQRYPLDDSEPSGHGLHVHIGRTAFQGSDHALAMFAYLMGGVNEPHVTRIARRRSSWAEQTKKPVARVVASSSRIRNRKMKDRASQALQSVGEYSGGRGAINLGNNATVEIRAFRSTRDVNEFKAAVRLVYVAAEYVRYLRSLPGIPRNALHWSEFSRYAAIHHPQAFGAISGLGK